MGSRAEHWDRVYGARAHDTMSWFQSEPTVSLDLIGTDGRLPTSVVDVGAGESRLVDRLLDAGVHDITLVDVSATALDAVRRRLGSRADEVRYVRTDLLEWSPDRTFEVWHDRAVFHFLTTVDDRRAYVARAAAAVAPHGRLVLASFAPDGPGMCSGLAAPGDDARSLASEFGASFDLVESREEMHITPSGVEQPFIWVVLKRREHQQPR